MTAGPAVAVQNFGSLKVAEVDNHKLYQDNFDKHAVDNFEFPVGERHAVDSVAAEIVAVDSKPAVGQLLKPGNTLEHRITRQVADLQERIRYRKIVDMHDEV